MRTKHKNLKILLGITALILMTLACSSIQFGVVQPTAVGESQPDMHTQESGPAEVILEEPTVTPPVVESGDVTVEASLDAYKPLIVTAWLGHIASLPEGSQFDDMVVLSPEGTGEFGLAGATPEVEAEIRTLRDAAGPQEYVHLWGELNCGVEDYNGCQLLVENLQYGANYSESQVQDWVGTIVGATFNGVQTHVFELAGSYPMRYSIHASQDEALQSVIESLRDTGAVVQVSGRLLVGIPDVNGTRIEVSSLEVLEPGTRQQPEVETGFDPTADWPVFVNDRYNYQFRYPMEAALYFHGPEGFSGDELPEGMSVDQYMDVLLKEYTDRLCVEIKYSLGWIYIAAPPNKEKMYTPCGPTGVGAGDLIPKMETIYVGDQLYQAKGHEFFGKWEIDGTLVTGETLDKHSEMFMIELEDGTMIRFGSLPDTVATYEDYLMKTREVLLQIIGTYEALD